MYGSIRSAMLFGAEGYPVNVEVQVSKGLPGFRMVGRPDETTREARDRARAAVMSSGLEWPAANITVNLAPSSDRKTGSGLDLAIAIGVLVASEQIPHEAVEGLAFLGELGLDGSLRRVAGMVPMVGVLGELDVVVPVGSATEARVAALGRVRLITHLAELLDVLIAQAPWPDHEPPGPVEEPECARARRPRRRPRSAVGPSGPRDRGRRRSPHPLHRTARFGQDHAGGPTPRPAPSVGPDAGARSDDGPLGRRRDPAAGWAHPTSAVPGAAPHDLGDRPGRRRLAHVAPGGDLDGALRCPVPRRTRRVLTIGARRAPSAARTARRDRRSSPPPRRVAGRLPAGRRDEPVSVRRRTTGKLRVRRRRAAPVCPPGLRPAARPVRSAGERPPSGGRRSARQRAGGAVDRGGCSGRGRS